MATEFLQDSGKRGTRSPSHAVESPDPDGRGQQQAGIQNEQRFLEPGSGATSSEHGSKSFQFQSELAGTRFYQFDTCTFSFTAKQWEPKSRHHTRGSCFATTNATTTTEYATGP